MLQSSQFRCQRPFASKHQLRRRDRQCLLKVIHQRRNSLIAWMPPLLFMILLTLLQSPSSTAIIVPNEVPSILSLVYSNIPPIKKGTDSRLGFGFRLGQNADFQILVELGPQKETRPVGDQDNSDGSSFNKRQVNKTQQRAVLRDVAKTEKTPSTWLEKWSSAAYNSTKKKVSAKDIASKKHVVHKSDPSELLPPQPLPVSNQALQQLQLLYKLATTSTTEEIVTMEHKAPVADEAAIHLHERLKNFRAPASTDDLQVLLQKTQDQNKAEVTKELMDVSLDE